MDLNFQVTPKQAAFMESTVDETLFGGAAGGGKSTRPADRCRCVRIAVSEKQAADIKKNIPRARKITN